MTLIKSWVKGDLCVSLYPSIVHVSGSDADIKYIDCSTVEAIECYIQEFPDVECEIIYPGDTVHWVDPDNDECRKTGIARSFEYFGDGFCLITWDDDSVLECFTSELHFV